MNEHGNKPLNTMNENTFSDEGNIAVATAANDLRAAANDFAKTTTEQAAIVKDRALDTAHAIRTTAVQKAGQLKTVAAEKASHVKEVAQQQWDETRVKAKEIHVTAEDYIRQNPTKAVLGALGVGFLIGLIVRR
jgi:ElaB/YqjD/DUF883 family membrane-anchored ribosome-binding protein